MSTDLAIFSDDGFTTAMKIADTLVKSGMLPRGIDNPFKAFAIIQKGREIGVGPMRALTGIALIEGKPTVSPELKLEQFKGRGGHVKWIKSDNTIAHLYLKAPNGDEHEEIVTLDDMKTAGVAHKDNWKKYPKSMLRARCVGFGLRAIGEGDGSYTPDELGAVTNEEGEAVETQQSSYVPPSAPVGPNVPVPNKNGRGAWPKAVSEHHTVTATREIDEAYARTVNDGAAPSDLEVQLQRSIDAVTVEVIDNVTGEVSKQPKATAAQLKKLHAMVTQLKIDDKAYRAGLRKYYKCDSSKLLTKAQCADMIERLEITKARVPADMLPPDPPAERGDEPTPEEMAREPGSDDAELF